MDIETVPEQRRTHRRTLDMPARPSQAPRRFPARFSRLSRFPEGKIHRVAFLFARGNPRASPHFLHIALGKFQVIGKFFDAVINIPGRFICQSIGNQLLIDLDNLLNVLGRTRFMGRFNQAERNHICVKCFNKFFSKFLTRNPPLVGPINDFIINIGIVAHISGFISGKLQVTEDDIKNDICASMTDVAVIVDGNTTNIHPDLAGHQWLKVFFLSAHGIVNTQTHIFSVLR